MKLIHFQFILFCFCLIAINYSCEKADLQKSTPYSTEKISTRDAECNYCPNETDCCCVVTIEVDQSGQFQICGTTDGDAVSCSDESICAYDIDGLQHSYFELDNSNRTEPFCMAPESAFWIKKLNSGGATVNIKCQNGQTAPQNINLVFNGLGKKFVDVNGACEVEECE